MDKESIYQLQKIDCNCNDCKFMVRDLATYQKWYDYHFNLDLIEFENRKAKAIEDAKNIEDERGRESMLRIAHKMKHQFDKSKLLQYGNCEKYGKSVSFIPATCQLETQQCFEHRR